MKPKIHKTKKVDKPLIAEAKAKVAALAKAQHDRQMKEYKTVMGQIRASMIMASKFQVTNWIERKKVNRYYRGSEYHSDQTISQDGMVILNDNAIITRSGEVKSWHHGILSQVPG